MSKFNPSCLLCIAITCAVRSSYKDWCVCNFSIHEISFLLWIFQLVFLVLVRHFLCSGRGGWIVTIQYLEEVGFYIVCSQILWQECFSGWSWRFPSNPTNGTAVYHSQGFTTLLRTCVAICVYLQKLSCNAISKWCSQSTRTGIPLGMV